MKRIVSLLLAVVLVIGLTACGKKEKAVEETIDMYTLRQDMLEAGKSLPDMMTVSDADDNPAELFSYVSDEDYNKVDKFFISYSSEGKADEIVVIALKDSADIQAFKKSIEEHLTHRKNLFANYSQAEGARLDKAIITTKGRYIALIIAEEGSTMRKIFEEAIDK